MVSVPTGYKTLIEHVCPLSSLSLLPPENSSSSSDKSNAADYLNWTWQMSQAREEVIDAADMVDSMDIP